MISQGTFKAKLVDYGIKSTQAGKPQIALAFEVIEGDTVHNLTWFGSFNEGKAVQNTIKTLMSVCDLWCETSEFENKMGEIAESGKLSGLLNMDKEYSLVIEHEPDQKGVIRARIKWVNNPGGANKFDELAKGEGKKLFAGMNLSGTVAAFKAENPGLAKKVPF